MTPSRSIDRSTAPALLAALCLALVAACSSAGTGDPAQPITDVDLAAADAQGGPNAADSNTLGDAPSGPVEGEDIQSDPADTEGDSLTTDTSDETGPAGDAGAETPGPEADVAPDDVEPPTSVTACADGGEYATIQEAVDAADDGMTVYLCPGMYIEHVDLGGRSLDLRSTGSLQDTTIMGTSGSASVVTVTGTDTPGTPGSVTISGVALVGGVATFGGGVLCDGATLTLEEVAIGVNEAEFGGGLYADGCTLTITDSLVTTNVAAVTGGGVYIRESDVVITGSVFEDNDAWEGGGVAIAQSAMTLSGNEIRGNTSSADDGETHLVGTGGGGLWLQGTGEVTDSVIVANEAMRHGGGLYVLESPLDIHDNLFEENYTAVDGAGAYLNRGSASFHHNTLANNEAGDDAGGLRVFVGIGSRLTDNMFVGNTAEGAGGGLKVSHSSNIIARNVFWANVSDNVGGGIELDNEHSDVVDCQFIGNRADRGGGIHGAQNLEEYLIQGCIFDSNHAEDCGGGLALDNAVPLVRLHDLTFTDNTTSVDGGGLCVELVDLDDDDSTRPTSHLWMTNSVFDGNEAGDDGGAVHVHTGAVALVNVVMHGNTCTDVGCAVSMKSPSAAEIRNSIITQSDGAPAVFADPDEVTVVFAFSDLFGNADGPVEGLPSPAGGAGNISAAPLYSDPGAGDFSLLPGSPAIDTGDPDLLDPDGSRSDMGAHGGPFASGAL